MGKEEIKALMERVHGMGFYFMKKTVTMQVRDRITRIVQPVRIALDQNILNDSGEPDDERSKEMVIADQYDALKKLYYMAKMETVSREQQEKLIPEEMEADLIKSYYDLYYWTMLRLRELGIDVPHDVEYKSTVLTDEGIPIGTKYLPKERDELRRIDIDEDN